MSSTIRVALAEDCLSAGTMLHDFNVEYDDIAPEPAWLADRLRGLIDGGDTAVLLVAEDGRDRGVAVLRIREALWEAAPEAYLAELYIQPDARGRGLGRALLTATIDHARERGCTYMDVATTSTDTAAVALYESFGFDRHERRGEGVTSYYFERDL